VAQFGEMSLDFKKMELCRSNEPIALTLREFKVLRFLVCRPEIVISRRALMVAVWPRNKRSSPRGVDNCIAKLRQKIEPDPKCPVYLWTVQGVGYKFVPQEKNSRALQAPRSKTQVGRACDQEV
jgi:two-component system, OmpR family, alkaline phosphatase synthesis response regulator PhoP